MHDQDEQSWIIETVQPPKVTFDPSCDAWSLKFESDRRHLIPHPRRVAQTLDRSRGNLRIHVDVDEENEIHGIEVIGTRELQVSELLESLHITAPGIDFSQAVISVY